MIKLDAAELIKYKQQTIIAFDKKEITEEEYIKRFTQIEVELKELREANQQPIEEKEVVVEEKPKPKSAYVKKGWPMRGPKAGSVSRYILDGLCNAEINTKRKLILHVKEKFPDIHEGRINNQICGTIRKIKIKERYLAQYEFNDEKFLATKTEV